MRRIPSLVAAVALILVAAPAARAQAVHVEVTPFIGGFVPTAALGSLRVNLGLGAPINVKTELTSAVAFGGRIDVMSRGRFGLQGVYFHSNGGVRTTVAPVPKTFDAVVQGGALKVNYQATSAQTGTDLVLSAGVAGVSHSGAAFALTGNQFDAGAALGAGLHVVINPSVTLRFDTDLFVHKIQVLPIFPSVTMGDLVVTAGLGLKLGR